MKHIFYALAILILMSGCLSFKPSPPLLPRYGIEHNLVRDSLGIVLLDSSWVVDDVWEGATVWKPRVQPPDPCHGRKQITYFNDTLYSELDAYGNGETYQEVDGTAFVSLSVIYFYRPPHTGPWGGPVLERNIDSAKWVCKYSDSIRNNYISKAKADSIIKAWGIKN